MSWSPPVPISVPSCRILLRDQAGIFQVHASSYLNPGQLPPGAVLVVGCGPSGAQIAEELFRAGRRVFLSLGRHARFPRRYRGHDVIWWTSALGRDKIPAEERGPERPMPVISGAYGGYTIDFRRFAIDGMTLLGRVTAARDGVARDSGRSREQPCAGRCGIRVLPRLAGRPRRATRPRIFRKSRKPARCCRIHSCISEPMRFLDLRGEGIGAVIWATGYVSDFGWIDVPVLGPDGEPRASRWHQRSSRPLFPRPAMAVDVEILVPVRRRRRCRRARRPHRRPSLRPSIPSLRGALATKQSSFLVASKKLDCFAALAMTELKPSSVKAGLVPA